MMNILWLTWVAVTVRGMPVVSTVARSTRLYVGHPHVTGAKGLVYDTDGIKVTPSELYATVLICMHRPGVRPAMVMYAEDVATFWLMY